MCPKAGVPRMVVILPARSADTVVNSPPGTVPPGELLLGAKSPYLVLNWSKSVLE